MQELLLEIWAQEKTTVIFITHDIEEAVYLSQRVVMMAAQPGRIIGEYSVDLPDERTSEVRDLPQFLSLKRELTNQLKQYH
jgi:NitT/TauT family transport system ATP-binding protein